MINYIIINVYYSEEGNKFCQNVGIKKREEKFVYKNFIAKIYP